MSSGEFIDFRKLVFFNCVLFGVDCKGPALYCILLKIKFSELHGFVSIDKI